MVFKKTPIERDWKAATQQLKRVEPGFHEVIKSQRGSPLEIQRSRSPFEALIRSIIYQQITGKAAATIHQRFLDSFPRRRPIAETIVKLDSKKLRSCGLSSNKARAIIDLAEHRLRGDLPGFAALNRLNNESIIDKLSMIHGIGPWTVQMLLIFQLGRVDVLPSNDLGVCKGATIILGRKKMLSSKQLEKHAKRWAPYRSIASWYCWRATELKPK